MLPEFPKTKCDLLSLILVALADVTIRYQILAYDFFHYPYSVSHYHPRRP